MKAFTLLSALVFAAFSTSVNAAKPVRVPVTSVNPMDPSAWQIGPITSVKNYSVNMPLSPSAHPGGGWYFDIPYPTAQAGHVHYVTFKHGTLSGKTRLVMRYRIEMADGVQIVPTKEQPNTFPSILTLYFQRRGDDWSANGKYEAYRWWATFASVMPLTAGEHELSVPLNGNWTALGTSSATTNPRAFGDAVREAERVGFTLGGGTGFGHGVYATGPARFVVTSFQLLSDTDFAIRAAPGS